MVLEALASSNYSIVYDTISATEHYQHASSHHTSFLPENNLAGAAPGTNLKGLCPFDVHVNLGFSPMMFKSSGTSGTVQRRPNSAVKAHKKRRRRPRVCKNKEEEETQRMTHIAVERNRRKQMNEHLAILRSLMPESYIQRNDQASIVGGAIDFVKELEQHLQSLEATRLSPQKRTECEGSSPSATTRTGIATSTNNNSDLGSPPFAQFFTYPQYSWCQVSREYPVDNRRAVADIETMMIETHANLRILSRKRSRQLIKMVSGFLSLRLSILHINVTTLDPYVLYSFSLKVEEGCHLSSADDIAGAVHHMLTLIEDEADLSLVSQLG